MYEDNIADLKNAIGLYEKELASQTEFLKKLRQPENKINDPEINAVILVSVIALSDSSRFFQLCNVFPVQIK